jgi:hypothetical protein
MTLVNLDPLPFILHFLNQFWVASRLVCSLCEAVAGTAVSLTKVAVGHKVENKLV